MLKKPLSKTCGAGMSIEPEKKVPRIGRTRQESGERETWEMRSTAAWEKKFGTCWSRERWGLVLVTIYIRNTQARKWRWSKIAHGGAGLCWNFCRSSFPFSLHSGVNVRLPPKTQAPGLWRVVRSEEMKKTERWSVGVKETGYRYRECRMLKWENKSERSGRNRWEVFNRDAMTHCRRARNSVLDDSFRD